MWNDSRLEILVVSVGLELRSYNCVTFFFPFLKINLTSKGRPVTFWTDVSVNHVSVIDESLLEPHQEQGSRELLLWYSGISGILGALSRGWDPRPSTAD